MVRKFIYVTVIALFVQVSSVSAGTTGSEELTGSSSDTARECFEGFSRAMFKLNHGLDKVIFKPVAKGYRALPAPIRKGTGNVVDNLRSLLTLSNNVLQGNFGRAGNTAARFGINTTAGILGVFDPATKLGFEDQGKEDFGQTLGRWGNGTGCYFVLPVLGPTTVRDVTGTAASFLGGDPWYNVSSKNDTQYFKDSDYFISRTMSGIDFRSKNIESFDSLEKNSVDFYASIKSLYIQDRENKIRNTKSKIETQDDSDWDEIENQ